MAPLQAAEFAGLAPRPLAWAEEWRPVGPCDPAPTARKPTHLKGDTEHGVRHPMSNSALTNRRVGAGPPTTDYRSLTTPSLQSSHSATTCNRKKRCASTLPLSAHEARLPW